MREVIGGFCPVVDELLRRFAIAVVDYALVRAPHQAPGDIPAHAPKANNSNLHEEFSRSRPPRDVTENVSENSLKRKSRRWHIRAR